jgi:hypothetical protein
MDPMATIPGIKIARRNPTVIGVLCLVCIGGSLLVPSAAQQTIVPLVVFDRDQAKRHILSVPSRSLLNRATLHGSGTISFIVAAKTGQAATVAKQTEAMGGSVEFVADDVDYLRGVIPLPQARRLANAENVIDVDFGRQTDLVDFDLGANSFPDEDQQDQDTLHVRELSQRGLRDLPPEPMPLDQLQPVNSILPTGLIGAPQFIRDHPTYDGRGVTVAVLEGVGDLNHPMLQTARLLDGSVTNKVLDILDPRIEPEIIDDDGIAHLRQGFVRLDSIATNIEGKFEAGGKTYFAPKPGRYLFGIYSVSLLGLQNCKLLLRFCGTSR